jgi:hypothetical protein
MVITKQAVSEDGWEVVRMGTRLTQIPFDIETAGFGATAPVSVIGFALPLGCRVFVNTDGRDRAAEELEDSVGARFETAVKLSTHHTEQDLLESVAAFLEDRIADQDYLLVAYNGERFNGGFDLPFLRTRYLRQGLDWPFDDIPYADLLPIISDRFNTTVDGDEQNDLVGAYDVLIGGSLTQRDPFEESSEAVEAFEAGELVELVAHNVADIRRTAELGAVAQQYCATSEFSLKSLTPSCRDPNLS